MVDQPGCGRLIDGRTCCLYAKRPSCGGNVLVGRVKRDAQAIGGLVQSEIIFPQGGKQSQLS